MIFLYVVLEKGQTTAVRMRHRRLRNKLLAKNTYEKVTTNSSPKKSFTMSITPAMTGGYVAFKLMTIIPFLFFGCLTTCFSTVVQYRATDGADVEHR